MRGTFFAMPPHADVAASQAGDDPSMTAQTAA
jgi:hypothetical protein